MIWNYLPQILSVSAGLGLVACLIYLIRTGNQIKNELTEELDELQKRWNKTNSDLASVRVKHGQAWEVFLPIMKTFEEQLGDKNDAIFLGQPIDLMYFKEDEILFVEVKTGNSRLSRKQRDIKKLVQEGKIRWVEVNDSLESVSQDTAQINSAATKTTQPKSEPEQHSES